MLELQPGENAILLHSREGCDNPMELGLWDWDLRCLSFRFFNITKFSEEELADRILFEKNWYPEEIYNNITYRFMSQNATLLFYNGGEERLASFQLILSSLNKTRNLDLYFNSEFVNSYEITSLWKSNTIETPELNLGVGENVVLLHSREGCSNPAELKRWNDTSCVSFVFFNGSFS